MKFLLLLSFFAVVFSKEISLDSLQTLDNINIDNNNTTPSDDETIQIMTRTSGSEDKEDSFDWNFSKEMFKQNKNENVIVSPISVKLLLTILAEAAGQNVKSQTRTELMQVLPNKKTLECARKYFNEVLSSLKTTNKNCKINIGSKGFVRNNVHLSQRLLANLEHHYKLGIEQADFNDGAKLADSINNWIKEVTEGQISSLVDNESISNAAILLINAVYFRGLWEIPFEKTMKRDFQVEPNVNATKEFMELTSEFDYVYSKELKARILRLPYEGRQLSMFLLLPFAADGLDELVEALDAEVLNREVGNMEATDVYVVLPKFKFDSSAKLNGVMKALGITEIFEDSATLTFFTAGAPGLKVSNIIQKAGIVVDEKGTEAFAATEIELIDKFGGDPREFVANHPFIFYIEDGITGAKLFSGIVNDPEF